MHVVSYAYDLADRVTQITYPSGRIVTYTRDSPAWPQRFTPRMEGCATIAAAGRITAVATQKAATAASVTLASGVTYQPLSNLVTALAYGNGLDDAVSHTLDYEVNALLTRNGATALISRSHARTDALNLTGITDGVTSANSGSCTYSPANRLQLATGPWGSKTFAYDGVGNRLSEATVPVSGLATTDTLSYPAGNNRVVNVVRGTQTVRSLTYDAAGNLLTDNGTGGNKTYVYNKRNRLSSATVGALVYNYTYNALEQLAIRTQPTAPTTTHFIHDRLGNVIAETAGGGPTGATGTVREYIWLPETEIAPTMGSRTVVDRIPVATGRFV